MARRADEEENLVPQLRAAEDLITATADRYRQAETDAEKAAILDDFRRQYERIGELVLPVDYWLERLQSPDNSLGLGLGLNDLHQQIAEREEHYGRLERWREILSRHGDATDLPDEYELARREEILEFQERNLESLRETTATLRALQQGEEVTDKRGNVITFDSFFSKAFSDASGIGGSKEELNRQYRDWRNDMHATNADLVDILVAGIEKEIQRYATIVEQGRRQLRQYEHPAESGR